MRNILDAELVYLSSGELALFLPKASAKVDGSTKHGHLSHFELRRAIGDRKLELHACGGVRVRDFSPRKTPSLLPRSSALSSSRAPPPATLLESALGGAVFYTVQNVRE